MNWWQRRSEQLDEEMQRHIELEIQQNIEAGMSPVEARYAALRKFGNVTLAKEESRDIWGWVWLEHFCQDLRYALRGFAATPNFTIVALLSLLLGIGASTALFSVVYGVLIAPYPYAKPNEIWAPAVVGVKETARGWHSYSRREFKQIETLPAFSQVMATTFQPVLMTGGSGPQSFYGVSLTSGAFRFIGVPPLIGRTFQPFDIAPDGEPSPVVVLTYNFWQKQFDGSPSAIGSKIVLNDVPHTVIGVMPPRFGWYTNESFWLPMNMNTKDDGDLNVIMRLRPGFSKSAAEAALQSLNLRLAAETPQNYPRTAFRTQLLNYMDITQASGEMTSSLHLLSLAVGFLLLIACVNVANLQLARTTTRKREIALRLAMGAGRGRLIRQLLTENIVLAVLGGILGVGFAIGATRLISALIPADYIPNEARIAVNGYVLLFSAAVSLGAGILFGLAPAIRSSRPDLTEALKDGGGGSSGSAGSQLIRGWLAIVEVGLSVILLAGAVLAIRGFTGLLHVDPGFQPEKTLMVEVPLSPKRYQTVEQRNTFDRNLLENVASLPGIESVAMGNGGMPFGGPLSAYSVDGRPAELDKRVIVGLVSSDYLRTLGVPLRRGRPFTRQEVDNVDRLALINETAAKLLFAGEDPLGRRMKLDLLKNPGGAQVLAAKPDDPEVTIIGITADTRNQGLRNATLPAVLVPYTLLAPLQRRLAIRAAGDPSQVLSAVRRRVRRMDSELPLSYPITLQQILGFETVEPRFNMALFSCFAGLGLALAAAGIFSVISYDVTQRTHEIGVRVALGASRRGILMLVLRIAIRVSTIGLALGLGGSFALERIVRFQVFANTSFDVLSTAGVILTLLLIALLAAAMPALRAGRVDPVVALRHQT